MSTKYIRGGEGFILFPEKMIHLHVRNSLGWVVQSAGTVEFLPSGAAHCFGGSASLKVKTAKDDSEKLNLQLGITPPAKLREVELALVMLLERPISKYGRDAVGVVLRELASNLLVKTSE